MKTAQCSVKFRVLKKTQSSLIQRTFVPLCDDTQLLKDRQGNGVDGVIDEYLTEAGLEILQEKTHAIITGWNATS